MNAPVSAAPSGPAPARPGRRGPLAEPSRERGPAAGTGEAPTRSATRRGRGPSLSWRLLLLVTACVLPMVLFGLGNTYLNHQTARAEAGRRTLDLARSLALAVERDIQGRLWALQALALSRSAQAGDVEGFRPAAEALLARQMPGANILLLREDGQQILNTAVPPGQPLLARRDTTTLRRLFASGQPSVSDVFVGVTLRRPIVALEVPVFGRDGRVVYGLTLNPTTEAFNEILRRQRLPEPWVLGLYDGRGAFVARSRDGERATGQPAGPLLLPRLLSDREGLLDTVSRDGVPVLTAFSRVDSFGWTAAVSVPLAEIAAPAWRSALRTIASGLVFLLAGLGLALLVAQRITGPIASLRDLAAAPDNGRPHAAAAATGLAEVDEVAEALVAGARERRAAAAALRESEFRLRLALDASQLGTWLWEAGGGGLSGDARCKALFGLPPEAPGDYATWAAAIEPEDRPAAEAAAARALASSDPHDEYDREYRSGAPTGSSCGSTPPAAPPSNPTRRSLRAAGRSASSAPSAT